MLIKLCFMHMYQPSGQSGHTIELRVVEAHFVGALLTKFFDSLRTFETFDDGYSPE